MKACRHCKYAPVNDDPGLSTYMSLVAKPGARSRPKTTLTTLSCSPRGLQQNNPTTNSSLHIFAIINLLCLLIITLYSAAKFCAESLLKRKRFRLLQHVSPWRGLSVCRLSRSCTLFKPFDGSRCAWRVPLWGPMTHCVI